MYLFDFEGALTDSDWRKHLFPTEKDIKNLSRQELQWRYNKAQNQMFMDKPKQHNCTLYHTCFNSAPTAILTSVMDVMDHRQQIELWLENWKLPKPNFLIMRGENQNEKGQDFKLNVCKKLMQRRNLDSWLFMFDDSDDVIIKLIENGIPGIILR